MGMFHRHGKRHDHPPFDREKLRGSWVNRRLADISDRRTREQLERGLDLGLEAAPSVEDRTISCSPGASVRRSPDQHVRESAVLREHTRRGAVRRRRCRRPFWCARGRLLVPANRLAGRRRLAQLDLRHVITEKQLRRSSLVLSRS